MSGRTLLLGVTGSRAHGLEREDSDTDRRGVYAEPTELVLGLEGAPQAVRNGGGNVLWEARQAVKLALASSRVMTELLYLPGYEEADEDGLALAALRSRLLSREDVRRNYLRSAEADLRRIGSRQRAMSKLDYQGDKEADEIYVRKRARHVAISAIQGSSLWREGTMEVRLDEEQRGIVLNAEEEPDYARTLVRRLERVTERPTPLPEAPDREAAEQWLLRVRERNWKRAE